MFDLAAVDDREEAIPFPIDVRIVFVWKKIVSEGFTDSRFFGKRIFSREMGG
jgi:hypothetical protein